ncbi:MAG: 50S ribosomal protein L21 [bacterium]
MYAIVESGGKQYKIAKGDVLKIEKLENKVGETVEIDKVLMIVDGEDVSVGKPHIKGAKVVLEIVRLTKGKKVIVFKYKPKKDIRKVRGHRHQYSTVKVKDIEVKK